MHSHLAIGDRNFGNVRRVTFKSKMHRDAAPHALRQRFTPSRFLGGQIEHAKIARLFLQQLPPELVRIFLRQRGQFIHETLNRKRSMRMPHRTQPLHGHSDFRLMTFDRHIRNRIRKIVNTLNRRGIIGLPLHHHRRERSAFHNRLPNEARSPTDRIAARINAAFDRMQKCGTIPTALHIVFARPNYFDRSASRFRDVRRFHHKVRLRIRPASKASTEKSRVQLNFFGWQPRDSRRVRAVHRLKL